MSEYDVVIIGGGAAGLSAALVLGRARRRVAVVDAGEPRNAPAALMHGFIGRDGTPPAALLEDGRAEVVSYGGDLVSGTVVEIETATGNSGGLKVTVSNGTTLSARRVLVTTGLRDEIPDVPGVRERWGRDVLHCPYCHGHEVRDQPLGVLGGSPESVEHALLIRQWSDDLVYFAHTGAPSEGDLERLLASGIRVVDGEVVHVVVDDDQLSGVQLAGGHVIPRTAVFVRPGFVPNTDLLVRLGCATDTNGWVDADSVGRTSLAGVWVAGNAVNPRAQVITAAGEGSAAAIAINADLVDEDVVMSLRAFHASLPS